MYIRYTFTHLLMPRIANVLRQVTFFREGVNKSGASNRNKKVIGRQMGNKLTSLHTTLIILKNKIKMGLFFILLFCF